MNNKIKYSFCYEVRETSTVSTENIVWNLYGIVDHNYCLLESDLF